MCVKLSLHIYSTVHRVRANSGGGAWSANVMDDGGEDPDQRSRSVELPQHLTEKILCCIDPLESARLATVCKTWAATVSERLATLAPHLFALELAPRNIVSDQHLVEFNLRLARDTHRGAVLSPPIDDEDSPVIPARLPQDSAVSLERCVGAISSGRVAFLDWCGRVVLVNPVTGAIQSVGTTGSTDAWARFPAVTVVSGADAFFFSERGEVALWRRRANGEEWYDSKLVLPLDHHKIRIPCSAAYCNGIFYALDNSGRMFAVDGSGPPPQRITRLPVPSLSNHCKSRLEDGDGHLLESDGEILFVGAVLAREAKTVCSNSRSRSCGELVDAVVGFEVYRLDLKELRWVEVEELAGDDKALFVSQHSSCRSNCIYFARDESSSPRVLMTANFTARGACTPWRTGRCCSRTPSTCRECTRRRCGSSRAYVDDPI